MDVRKLKSLRKAAKLTRKAAIEALNKKGLSITEQTLLNWEKGIYSPTLEDAVKLADVYGTSIEVLAG